MKRTALSMSLACLLAAGAQGSRAAQDDDKEVDRLKNAAVVLDEIFGMPDGIPKELLDRAECVIVFPSVKKLAVGIGGSYGRGAIACRGSDTSSVARNPDP